MEEKLIPKQEEKHKQNINKKKKKTGFCCCFGSKEDYESDEDNFD